MPDSPLSNNVTDWPKITRACQSLIRGEKGKAVALLVPRGRLQYLWCIPMLYKAVLAVKSSSELVKLAMSWPISSCCLLVFLFQNKLELV